MSKHHGSASAELAYWGWQGGTGLLQTSNSGWFLMVYTVLWPWAISMKDINLKGENLECILVRKYCSYFRLQTLPPEYEKIDYLRDARCVFALNKMQLSNQLPVPAYVSLTDPPTFLKSLLMSCGWWMASLRVPHEIQVWSSDKSLCMPCPRISTACSMCRTSIDRNPLQSKCYPNINTLLDFLVLFFSSSIYNLFFALAQLFEILLGCSPILSYTNIYTHLYFVKHDLNCLCRTSEMVPLWSSPLVPGLRGG